MRVHFDTREIYFLTQFLPLARALRKRGAECTFVAYENRPTQRDGIRDGFAAAGIRPRWFETREDALEFYQDEEPDWIVFGREYGYTAELAERTRTAMVHHGTGAKTTIWSEALSAFDVRFVSGPFYAGRLREQQPSANLQEVGYAKLDPLLRPEPEDPIFDVASVGLEPERPTLLYAPTHSPSSFPKMHDEFPAHFADFNILVKPHMLSFFGTRKRAHRRKMERWRAAPNVYVAPISAFDPVPFMRAADLLISDLSSVSFEFAAANKPVVMCRFAAVHWTRRGPLSYRLKKRVDSSIEEFLDIGPNVWRYRDLRAAVDDELAHPERHAARRAEVTRVRLGPTDGRTSERIADYLEEHVDAARCPDARRRIFGDCIRPEPAATSREREHSRACPPRGVHQPQG